jgi:hypothetical protein
LGRVEADISVTVSGAWITAIGTENIAFCGEAA